MVTAPLAAVSPTTADAAEEIPETTADAGTGIGIETGMIPAGKEDLTHSRRPAALADVRKKIHSILLKTATARLLLCCSGFSLIFLTESNSNAKLLQESNSMPQAAGHQT